jgi:hypothetical protein
LHSLFSTAGFTVIYRSIAYNSSQVWGYGVSNFSLDLNSSGVTSAVEAPEAQSRFKPALYVLAFLAFTIAGVAGVWNGNQVYGPEMYGEDGMVPAAEAFAEGKNYSVFDLNLNIRHLKDETIARLKTTPDVVILGASHWQEAHADLLPGYNMFNAHVHRDYWEDLLGVTEILVKHNRLPKKLIISIRDLQFTPLEARKDFLWEPGIPYYRAMADRLGIEKESYWTSLPFNRIKAMLSISMLFDNFTRWYNADERPHAAAERHFNSLDTLLPDGSILWSQKHLDIFTQERARNEAIKLADQRLNMTHVIDPAGVLAFEHLLDYLKEQGVQVYLINPPYNPIYYDRIQGSPYATGMKKVEALMERLSKQYDMPLIGGFNPHKSGCEASMYIDAEHSNPTCLSKLLQQFAVADKSRAQH